MVAYKKCYSQRESDNRVFSRILYQASDIDLRLYNAKYGKGFMKKCRVSPDGYIQMIMQLAYFKLHREIVRTYEPATLRWGVVVANNLCHI